MIPIEILKIILDYLNDIDTNRYFGIYKKINLNKYKILKNICWLKYRERTDLYNRWIYYDKSIMYITNSFYYYLPSLNKKINNLIRIEYTEYKKKIN